jgi:hypothetical protein
MKRATEDEIKTDEWGALIKIESNADVEAREAIMRVLIADARARMPLGTVVEIRCFNVSPSGAYISPCGPANECGIAWYYNADPSQMTKGEDLFINHVDSPLDAGRYGLIARIKIGG